MAPEVYLCKLANEQVDQYSFSICLWELMARKPLLFNRFRRVHVRSPRSRLGGLAALCRQRCALDEKRKPEPQNRPDPAGQVRGVHSQGLGRGGSLPKPQSRAAGVAELDQARNMCCQKS